MIAVIADDFSGAAEIAGIGLRYGLNCEVQTERIGDGHPDLLVIDTNTRSSSESEARRIVKETVPGLSKDAQWIYKKTDSVFRGHVAAELETLLDTLDIPSALLIPANPSMGRVIIGGIYTIDGCPLHETFFSRDPESAYSSSRVIELLNTSSAVMVSNCDGLVKDGIRGIVIGNADKLDHLKKWALQVHEDTLPAGGADFFTAILEAKGYQVDESKIRDDFSISEKVLIIQGAGFSSRHHAEEKIENPDHTVNHLEILFSGPDQLNDQTLNKWIGVLVTSLREKRITVLRFKTNRFRTLKMSQTLAGFTGKLLYRLFQKAEVPHIIVEGGSTASAIVRRMNWTRWTPIQAVNPGSVQMQEAESGVTLTVKPGSYAWPESIEKLIYSPSF
jgi:uncharacterized protein YgbK (DUF1537 family)